MSIFVLFFGSYLFACNGKEDTGEESTSTNSTDCAQSCAQSDGGPPSNDCLLVDNQESCVYTCTTDEDCLPPFHSGCSSTADNGTAICTISS